MIAVVVLCWNGGEDVLRCLESLRTELRDGDVVIVVDNGSTDGSVAAVSRFHPWALLIENGDNRGFAGGNNVGIRAAMQKGFAWVLLLNQDTVIEPGCLAELRVATARSSIGAAQPVLVSSRDVTIADSLGLRPRRTFGGMDVGRGSALPPMSAATMEIFGPCGAAMLLRTSVLADAGLFDEDLFLLAEDLDLAFRVRMTGSEAVLVPNAIVRHRRGVSASVTGAQARRRKYWLQRNTVAVALRYWPLRWTLLFAPLLLYRIASALLLSGCDRHRRCWPLWRRFLRERPASRRMLATHGLDRWFS